MNTAFTIDTLIPGATTTVSSCYNTANWALLKSGKNHPQYCLTFSLTEYKFERCHGLEYICHLNELTIEILWFTLSCSNPMS